jgi:hypothetical protein
MRFFFARGIVAEPATKPPTSARSARRGSGRVADGADSPTRGAERAEAARPTNFASQNSMKN